MLLCPLATKTSPNKISTSFIIVDDDGNKTDDDDDDLDCDNNSCAVTIYVSDADPFIEVGNVAIHSPEDKSILALTGVRSKSCKVPN